MKKKIYITNINTYFGGTLVLSALCKTLREIGYDAELMMIPYLPREEVSTFRFIYDSIKKNIKFLIKNFIKKYVALIVPNATFVKYFRSAASVLKVDGIKIKWLPFFNKENSILLYSEDIYGNPLRAKYVVRWLLYYYDYLDNLNAYSKDDLFICYREVFNDSHLNPYNYKVTISYFNNQLYRQYNFGDRDGKCYIIHKGWNRPDLPKEFDGPIIQHNMLQEDIVKILNNHKFCYCYDPQTFYMKVAVVCGCIPILIMEEGKLERDYLSENEHHYGIAYGNTPEQISYAISTRDKCLQTLNFQQHNRENAENFVDILESKFGTIRKLKFHEKSSRLSYRS